MELVDMLDLGSSASRRGSSSLPARTKKASLYREAFFMQFYDDYHKDILKNLLILLV